MHDRRISDANHTAIQNFPTKQPFALLPFTFNDDSIKHEILKEKERRTSNLYLFHNQSRAFLESSMSDRRLPDQLMYKMRPYLNRDNFNKVAKI